MPILALGCAAMWQRVSASTIAVIAAWTLVLVVHGLTYPWRLFQIANGENFVGQTLSTIWHSDFSRLFPSFIRVNFAAYVASALLITALGVWAGFSRPAKAGPHTIAPLGMTLALALAFIFGRRPAGHPPDRDAGVCVAANRKPHGDGTRGDPAGRADRVPLFVRHHFPRSDGS